MSEQQVALLKEQNEAKSAAPVPATPMEMISHAVANGGDVTMIEKLMELAERWDANQGRKEFDQAIAAAKAEIPVIKKNRDGHNSKYADFSAYAAAIDPVLAKHGLSYRFRTKQENGIEVTCILAHSAGHSEESTLKGPEDKTGNKNPIQSIGSTLTYLQRYTLVQALGLAAAEDDDGKAADAGETISEDQLTQLEDALTGRDVHAFMKYFKIDTLADMPATTFKTAMQMIEKAKQHG